MKKIFVATLLVTAVFAGQAQVIKQGKGRSVYVRVEDTSATKPFQLKKHEMVQLNVFDLIFTDVSISYEHFSSDGTKGYQIPFSFNAGGLPDTSDYRSNTVGRFISSKNRIFQTGFNYNYYFNGQDKVSLYMGAGVQVGWFYYWKYMYNTPTSPYGYPYYGYVGNEKKIGNNYAGLIHGGILFNPRETVTFNLKAGFGLRRYATDYTEYTVGYFNLDVCLGFKF